MPDNTAHSPDPQNPQPGDVFALDPRAAAEYSVWRGMPAGDYPTHVRCIEAPGGDYASGAFLPTDDERKVPPMFISSKYLSAVQS